MKKTNIDRIRFYTRKANEYSAFRDAQRKGRTDRRVSCHRFQRLMQYKSALDERLRRERDEMHRTWLA